MRKPKYNKVPRFYGLRIYTISTMLYFFLVFPVAGILLFKYIPDYMQRNNLPGGNTENSELKKNDPADSLLQLGLILGRDTLGYTNQVVAADTTAIRNEIVADNPEARTQIGGTVALLVRLLLISFILGFAFNLPFKIYFSRKRKNKTIPHKLQHFCKKFLLKSAFINTAILFLSYGITIGYMLYFLLFGKHIEDINRQFYIQFFFITVLASLLTLMLVYFWQKHRVHIRYLEQVFSQDELRKRIFTPKPGRIRNRLWVASAMTTLLPLLIVIFYLFLSLTQVKELDINNLNKDELNILLGKYTALNLSIDLETVNSLYYVNAINSVLMLLGISTSILIALTYIVLFVMWTTEDIVFPVRELLANMQKAGRGELDNLSIVRTNDEIGVLTEGYNEMSNRLKNYFYSLNNINKANARFVPKQFLEFLGKESITDIQLGDQVQKEMTVLFSDIRDFTSMSEKMTPKENFDFLNNYLGYMEPVIRNNNGFIDKFIGDSIMALFPEKAEDAINAAIEMRLKLIEFNDIMEQFGKPLVNSGIGIHSGLLMLGIIGGEGRMDGTVISDAVNLTSRIEGLTKVYGSSIVITEDTLIRLSDPSQYNFRYLDVVKVKGKKEAVYIFEILDGDPDELKMLKINSKEDYGKAMQAYKKQEFNSARKIFEDLCQRNPSDKVTQLYIERCKRNIETGVPDHWDGVEIFDTKF